MNGNVIKTIPPKMLNLSSEHHCLLHVIHKFKVFKVSLFFL